MMRQLIAKIVLFSGLITWLISIGLLIAYMPGWSVWLVWFLSLPALILATTIILGRRSVPDETKVVNHITMNEIKPRFGEMKGENE